ncbi:MAG: hypothetical protein RI531_07745, partial [Haloferacaceae archaeon]|nr:hypothetical protein [Haloferacaceae archaeon]
MEHRAAAVGLGAVFGGTTTVLVLLGLLYQLALIALALPFALATAMMYLHASGRLLQLSDLPEESVTASPGPLTVGLTSDALAPASA